MEIKLSQAIDGFILFKQVAGLSPYSIRNYTLDLRRLSAYFQSDPLLNSITASQLRAFLYAFQTTQLEPAGVAPRPPRLPSAKTIANLHTTLSSFWTWAVAETYANHHLMREVDTPHPATAVIQPFSREEVQALLKSVEFTASWTTRPNIRSSRPPAIVHRDRALILFLLDTGVRAAELCALTISDVDLKSGSAVVVGKSRLNAGQGKRRVVQFGNQTRKALWEYATHRSSPPSLLLPPGGGGQGWGSGLAGGLGPFFTTADGRPLDRRHLATHLRRLGARAGIPNVYTHRFRHTFAITYLRNGGDAFTLQQLLGHSSLDMCRRYLALAQADCAAVHRRAGPVDNWRL